MKSLYTSELFIRFRRLGRTIGINKFIRPLLDLKAYQTNFDQIMIKTLQEKDVFWDIGSNQGEVVKKVKSIFKDDVYCIAFEPHPILFKKLKKLSFKNYQAIEVAVSNYVGEAGFTYGLDSMQTTGRLKTSKSKYNKVRVVDFEYSLKVLKLKIPNVIKIDVEGEEYEVLNSIFLNLSKLKKLRAIFVEIHISILDKRNLTNDMYKLIKKFEMETDFKLSWIDISHFKMER